MRLATFNVLHGRSTLDGRVDADRFAAAMARLDVDVLGLQEVDRGQQRSGYLDQTEVAARALGAVDYRFAPALVGTPGERCRPARDDVSDADEPSFGVGLVSRWPVRSWRVIRVPAAPVRWPVHVPGPPGRFLMLRDEPRVVLAGVLETPHGPLTVATTHLSFAPGWNMRQLRGAVRGLRGLPAPRVLLGDLNMPAGLAGLVSRWRPLARCATYPALHPRVQLDHVLADVGGVRARPVVSAVSTPSSAISDHRPLVVHMTWRASPGS